MSIIRVHRAYGAAISGVPKGVALWRVEAYAITDRRPSVTVHRAYGAAISGVPRGVALWKIEAHVVTQVLPFVTVHRAYGAAVSGVPKGVALWSLEAYTIIAPRIAALSHKANAYAVVHPAQGVSVRGLKSATYAVLERGPVSKDFKLTLYTAVKVSPPVTLFKYSGYTLIQGPLAKARKIDTYTVLEKVSVKGTKTVYYSALTLRPPSILTYKSSAYCILKRRPPITGYRTSFYAILIPVIPNARGRKKIMYAALKRLPPALAYSLSMYSVLKPRPPVRLFKAVHYAVVSAPPIAVLVRKASIYTIIQGGSTILWKEGSYSIINPITNGPSRGEKLTKYTVVQYIEPPNGYRITNVS